MSNLAIPAPSASTPPDQSITASLTVEVMTDLDDGQPTLVASTEGNQGDLQVVTTSQVLAKVAEQHRVLDRQAQLAIDYQVRTRESAIAATADGALTVAGQALCREIADEITSLAATTEDPRAFVAEWLRAFSARMPRHPSQQHPAWCDVTQCVTYNGEDGPITEHRSKTAAIPAPPGMATTKQQIVSAYMIADTSFVDCTPGVSIYSNGEGTLVESDGLGELIDRTADFLDQLRIMRVHIEAAQK